MTLRVLIIPEDFRHDQYILTPLFRRLLEELGKPRAKIEVCKDPLLQGVSEALKDERLEEIFERYDGMVDLYLLCVDRDAIEGRRDRLDQIEQKYGTVRTILAENAWEEVETWLLAGLPLPAEWQWRDVRAHRDVKEAYFQPYAKMRGVESGPGGGRKALGDEASRRLQAVQQKCPEDFGDLSRRIGEFVGP